MKLELTAPTPTLWADTFGSAHAVLETHDVPAPTAGERTMVLPGALRGQHAEIVQRLRRSAAGA